MADLRSLVIVLGDRLDHGAAAFDGFDTDRDAVWMAEVDEESAPVVSIKLRSVLFLSAMRHFAAQAQVAGRALQAVSKARRSVRLEFFCREQRRRHGILMASKPYAASGQYIARMSPHRKSCRDDPAQRSGADAFPFTTLYWDFLPRHQQVLARDPALRRGDVGVPAQG